ncbi:MAG TPA: hypothetical protein VIT85_02000 [Solirubrobacterales bacterium]
MGRTRATLVGIGTVALLLLFAAPALADQYVQGGDFEGGTPVSGQLEGNSVEGIDHPNWVESDDRFPSPVCSLATCPTGVDEEEEPTPIEAAPRGGTNWAWFGGYGGAESHAQSLTQIVSTPTVTGATLSLYAWVGNFARQAATLSVRIDGQAVLTIDSANRLDFIGYTRVDLPLGDLAAGQHTLSLTYASPAGASLGPTSISVDDVSIEGTPVPATPAGPAPAPETKIKKVQVQVYTAKQGKTGSTKRPGHLYKATQGKTGKAAKAKVVFSGEGGVGALRFECRLDRGAFKPCKSPAIYKKLKLGSKHKIEVRAVDSAGHVDATPALKQFTARTGKSGKTKDAR